MTTVNIPKAIIDPFYRYKRNIVKTQFAGGSTEIINLATIAKEIYRTEQDLINLLKKQLATSIQVKSKRVLLKGKFSNEQLEAIIEKYIFDNVLCNQCGNPETPKLVCNACGFNNKR